MVDINDIYKSNSDNIKAEDIGDNMWTMTIKTADVKEFKDQEKGTERKIVLTSMSGTKLRSSDQCRPSHRYGKRQCMARQPIMLSEDGGNFGGKPPLGIRGGHRSRHTPTASAMHRRHGQRCRTAQRPLARLGARFALYRRNFKAPEHERARNVSSNRAVATEMFRLT